MKTRHSKSFSTQSIHLPILVDIRTTLLPKDSLLVPIDMSCTDYTSNFALKTSTYLHMLSPQGPVLSQPPQPPFLFFPFSLASRECR